MDNERDALERGDLYEYLQTQFTDLASAKNFMRRWAIEMNEEVPGFGMISCRALSAHVSALLEGKSADDTGGDFFTNYLMSKYGPELYDAAWGMC